MEVVEKNVVSISLMWTTFGFIMAIFVYQVLVIYLMIGQFTYEWIIAGFLTLVFLIFPIGQLMIMFNPKLEVGLLDKGNDWIIWFAILAQIVMLFFFGETTVGEFKQYFQVPGDWWTVLLVWVQILLYGVEIILYLSYHIAMMY